QNRRPAEGRDYYKPSDTLTYQTDPNIIRDFDATNKPWPDALGQLLGFYGFGMRFVCEGDADGFPYNYLEIYRKDAAGPTEPKDIFLPASSKAITDAPVNVSTFHAGFDFHGVANSVFVETAIERHEIGVVLAPGFEPSFGDGSGFNSKAFLMSALQAP